MADQPSRTDHLNETALRLLAIVLIVESLFWVLIGLLDLGMPVSDAHFGIFFFLTITEALSIFGLVYLIRRRKVGLPLYALCIVVGYVLAYRYDFGLSLYGLATVLVLAGLMLIGGNRSYWKRIYGAP